MAWLVLTLLSQFPWFRAPRITRLPGRLGLLTGFGFFTPGVYKEDPHLFFRDEDDAGEAGPWREIRFRTLSPLRVLFHPTRRLEKAFGYCFFHLLFPVRDVVEPKRGSLVAAEYLALRRFACEHEAAPGVTHRRLMLCASYGQDTARPPAILSISEPIRLRQGSLDRPGFTGLPGEAADWS